MPFVTAGAAMISRDRVPEAEHITQAGVRWRSTVPYAVVAAAVVVDVFVLRALVDHRTSRWVEIGAVQVLFAAAVMFAASVPTRLTKLHLVHLMKTMDAVVDGDLDVEVEVHDADSSVAALAQRVASIVTVLRDVVVCARETAAALDNGWREIVEVSNTMSSTSETTAAQAAAAASAAEQMSSSVHAMAAGIEQLAATIREIAVHANDASKTAHQATEEASTARGTVARLSDACRQVDEVVRFINKVAGQTHMLALNATIEAARAGSAGRGFAVVADEVKELAEVTSRATDNADRSVEEIQAGSAGAASAMASIVETIGKVSNNQAAIAVAVEEQTATSNEIGRGAADIAAGSQEVARNVTALADVARVTAYGGAQGRTTAAELARVGELLQEQVGRFRTSVSDTTLTRKVASSHTRADGVVVVENSVIGTGLFQLDYQGSWCHSTANVETDDTNSYSSMPDDVVVLRFSGTTLRFFGVKDANHGIAAISIDGGPEVEMDEYSPTRVAQSLLFTSPMLSPGEHVATVRVTGRKNAESRYIWVTVDRLEVAS